MKIEAMYVLMDGTQADPHDCAKGKDGVLRHKNGVKVAIDGDGNPETVGDRTAMNSLAAGHHAGKPHPHSRGERHSSHEAPKADQPKPADPKPADAEPIPPVEGAGAVEGQQSDGAAKPQE